VRHVTRAPKVESFVPQALRPFFKQVRSSNALLLPILLRANAFRAKTFPPKLARTFSHACVKVKENAHSDVSSSKMRKMGGGQ